MLRTKHSEIMFDTVTRPDYHDQETRCSWEQIEKRIHRNYEIFRRSRSLLVLYANFVLYIRMRLQ